MITTEHAQRMNAQLWQLETGLENLSASHSFSTDDILARVIALMHAEKGFDTVTIPELSEGYGYDETEKPKKRGIDLSFCKGRK
jgi:hypothetical protein